MKPKTPLNFGPQNYEDQARTSNQIKSNFLLEYEGNIEEIAKRLVKSQKETKRKTLSMPHSNSTQKCDEKETINFLETLINNSNKIKTTIEWQTTRTQYKKKTKRMQIRKTPHFEHLEKKKKDGFFWLNGNSWFAKDLQLNGYMFN